MADDQNTDLSEEPTRQDFPEVKDKIVSSVEVTNETEGFGITVRFHDQTTLHFDIESRIVLTPVHSQWEQGEETILKQWKPIQSLIVP